MYQKSKGKCIKGKWYTILKKSSARIDSERRIDAALEDNDTKTGRHTLLEILIEQKLRIYIIRIWYAFKDTN